MANLPRPPCAKHTYCTYCDYSFPKHHYRLSRARRYIYHPYLFCGRGVGSITACHGAPLQPQCYLKIRRVRRTRIAHIAIIHSQTSLSVIAGEALYLSPVSILRARRASPLQSLAEARLSPPSCAFSLVTFSLVPRTYFVPFFLLLCGVVAWSFFCFVPSDAFETPPLKGQ